MLSGQSICEENTCAVMNSQPVIIPVLKSVARKRLVETVTD
jgi:hypothetical protein